MATSILPSKSFDKNYLLRLLNGNTEMMGVVLNEIFHNIPNCLYEIDSSLKAKDNLSVATFASRAKSAFSILRDEQLVLAFTQIESSARVGNLLLAERTFAEIYTATSSRFSAMHEPV